MSHGVEQKTIRTESGTYTVHRDAPHPSRPFAVFLTGGPGLSSAPEQGILSPLLREQVNLLWFDQLGSVGAPAHDPSLITWKRLADDVAFLIETEAGGSADILAHSGGTIATHYLYRAHPEVMRSVAWFSPISRMADGFGNILRRQLKVGHLRETDLTSDEATTLHRLLTLSETGWARPEIASLLGLFPKVEDFFDIYWQDKEARRRYDALAPEGHFSGLAFTMLMGEYLETSDRSVPSYSGVPVLALPGEGDPIAPWGVQGKALAEAIPHLQVETIPRGFHFPHIEAASTAVQIWSEFACHP